MSDFAQAIQVTIVGMGLVFLTLGLLMLIMVGLQRLLRGQAKPTQAVSLAASGIPPVPFALDVDPQPPGGDQAASVPDEVVAAIALALMVWKERQSSRPPQTTVVTFAPGSHAWRAAGRLS